MILYEAPVKLKNCQLGLETKNIAYFVVAPLWGGESCGGLRSRSVLVCLLLFVSFASCLCLLVFSLPLLQFGNSFSLFDVSLVSTYRSLSYNSYYYFLVL